MNLRQLEAFQEVMVSGSVSAAARTLGRSQPAVSALISTLEESVGCALFERRGGRLHPLPEAHFLFEESRDIPERIERLRLTMRGAPEGARHTLRIASMPGPAMFYLPDVISRFSESHPDVRFVLNSRVSTSVRQLVANQSCDIGLVDLGIEDSDLDKPLIDITPMTFNCVCALRDDEPLAALSEITPADLDGHPMALLLPSHMTNRQCRKAFHDAGATLNARYQTETFIPHLRLIEGGNLCSILDPMTAEAYGIMTRRGGAVIFRPFIPDIKMEVAILTATFAPPSGLAREFLDMFMVRLAETTERFSNGFIPG